jgi:hypothetical protein
VVHVRKQRRFSQNTTPIIRAIKITKTSQNEANLNSSHHNLKISPSCYPKCHNPCIRRGRRVKSSLKTNDLLLPEPKVWLSPFKLPPASRTPEVALPSPIPFVNYQELEPVAVTCLVREAATKALRKHSTIP